MTERNNRLSISQHHETSLFSSLSTPTGVAGNCSIPPEIFAESDPPAPFEKRRLRQISAYGVSTVRDSGRSSIMTNIKTTTGFPTSYRWSAYVTTIHPTQRLGPRSFCSPPKPALQCMVPLRCFRAGYGLVSV